MIGQQLKRVKRGVAQSVTPDLTELYSNYANISALLANYTFESGSGGASNVSLVGGNLRVDTTAPNFNTVRMYYNVFSYSEGEILTKIIPRVNTTCYGIGFSDNSNEHKLISPGFDSTRVRFLERQSSSSYTFTNTSKTFSPFVDETFYIRFNCSSTRIKTKAWNIVDSEPLSWEIDIPRLYSLNLNYLLIRLFDSTVDIIGFTFVNDYTKTLPLW